MCLAIVNIKGSISKQSLLNGWQSNPDGAGLLYISGGQLRDHKELRDFESFYRFYINLKIRNKKPILIHFRWATHGRKDIPNCHPFYVSKKLGFIHNGVIRGVGNSPVKSDTVLFNELVLQQYPADFLDDREIVGAIKENIDNSKLCFLDNKGGVKIINEQLGHWHEENWYSNTSYRPRISSASYSRPTTAPGVEPRRISTPAPQSRDWSVPPSQRTKYPSQLTHRPSTPNPSLFDNYYEDDEDENDYIEEINEKGICLNCGSKHAKYDADIECYICNSCARTLLT